MGDETNDFIYSRDVHIFCHYKEAGRGMGPNIHDVAESTRRISKDELHAGAEIMAVKEGVHLSLPIHQYEKILDVSFQRRSMGRYVSVQVCL